MLATCNECGMLRTGLTQEGEHPLCQKTKLFQIYLKDLN
jgi:hypothetical protein